MIFEVGLVKEYLKNKINNRKISYKEAMIIFCDLNNQFNIDGIELNSFFELLKIKEFYEITKIVFDNYVNSYKLKKFFVQQDNPFLTSAIDAYCIKNNIEITLAEDDDFQPSYKIDSTVLYIQDIKKIPRLTQEEEQALIVKAKEGDINARNKVAEANLRLVVSVAKGYSGMPLIDLISEGNYGLLKAIEKYEFNKGSKFSTYAVWWIRQYITIALHTQKRKIKLPVYLEVEISRYQKAIKILQDKLNRDPSIEELSEYLQIPEKKIIEMQRAQLEPISINEIVNEDTETTFENFIDSKAITPEEEYINSSRRDALIEIIDNSNLTARESQLLKYRYGLIDGHYHSLQEISEGFSLTRERIRQIEIKGIRKILKSKYMEQFIAYSDDAKTTKDLIYDAKYQDIFNRFSDYSKQQIKIVHEKFLNIYEKNIIELKTKEPSEFNKNKKVKNYYYNILCPRIRKTLEDVEKMMALGITFDDETDYSTTCRFPTIYELLKEYRREDVDYTIVNLSYAEQEFLHQVFGKDFRVLYRNPMDKITQEKLSLILEKIISIINQYNVIYSKPLPVHQKVKKIVSE